MVCLDEDGQVVRPALLWNDTRSRGAPPTSIAELGDGDDARGRQAWADAVGLVPVASFTVTKLRWLAQHEPERAARVAAVCLPHDWLTWRLAGTGRLADLVTDRGDASGTGYWSPRPGIPHRPARARLRPRCPAAGARPGRAGRQVAAAHVLGPGTGRQRRGGARRRAPRSATSCCRSAPPVSCRPCRPRRGGPQRHRRRLRRRHGHFLPLVVTLNAARVLDATARLLGVDHDALSRLALSAPAGSGGLVLVPYLEGERTPDKPWSTGALHGLTLATSDPAHLARSAVEGLLCGLADGLDAIRGTGSEARRVLLVGGAARAEAVRSLAPAVLGVPVLVPPPGEPVADGAARQAAWVLSASDAPPDWPTTETRTYEAAATPGVRERYAEARDHTVRQVDAKG
jgi:xylulokinase